MSNLLHNADGQEAAKILTEPLYFIQLGVSAMKGIRAMLQPEKHDNQYERHIRQRSRRRLSLFWGSAGRPGR